MNKEIIKEEISKKLQILYDLVVSGKMDTISFFDNLDGFIKSNKVYHQFLLELILKDFPNGVSVISSGKFGEYFKSFFANLESDNFNIIVVPGGIRKGEDVGDLNEYNSVLNSNDCVFIDDSYCTGGTFRRVSAEVKRINEVGILKVYVVYFDPKPESKDIIPENLVYLYNYYVDFMDKLKNNT